MLARPVAAWLLAVSLAGLLAGCGASGPRVVRSHAPRPRPPAAATTAPPPSLLRVATWNVKRLGQGEKRLDLVAGVIEARFDVVALQEVMTARGVEELLAELPGWAAAISERAVGRNGYEELYAVLYREDVARVRRAFLLDDAADEIAREPFVVCLDVARFDFCLITFHAIYGDRVGVRDAEIEVVALRAMDLRNEGAEKDWIVLGDFNRPDSAPGFHQFHDARWRCAIEPAATPTTIGLAKYTNAYDHVLVDPTHTREWTGRAERVDVVAGPCTDDFAWCRDEVADHAPVVAEFTLAGPDDD